ncbi:TIGR00730 family Rossman fold protein [candidate division KSB1 bacterium]|nr:TIGR00730 family Rossman fold protein [candidate division KSB1 bacterium]
MESICVYCASSRQVDPIYTETAATLGRLIAEAGYTLVYGGSARGTMGALANAALNAGGKVTGVMPEFMCDLEWHHDGLTKLVMSKSLHDRKQKMLNLSDAIVALAGGSGTLDELLEAISLKRLGTFTGPIVIVNTNHFYDHLFQLLDNIITQRFMHERHRAIWTEVTTSEQVIPAILSAVDWSPDERHFAVV